MQAEMNEALAKDQLVSALILRQSKLDAEQLAVRRDIAQEEERHEHDESHGEKQLMLHRAHRRANALRAIRQHGHVH